MRVWDHVRGVACGEGREEVIEGNEGRFGKRSSSRWEEGRRVSIAQVVEIIYPEGGRR